MGNNASSSSSSSGGGRTNSKAKHGSMSRGAKAKPGALDTATQLEAMYSEAINSKEVKEEMQSLFKDVRILVVGRSGSGKSTLIRLMVGEKGPHSICRGKAGEQDIGVEWRHPDPDLPLIFHDSNGIDVMGANRLKVIRKFLDKHQKSKDFRQRIHLVWYIFSAADTRFLDDGDLLEVLMEYEIPLLLIMTFNDQRSLVTQNVEGEPLEELLQRIKEPPRREKILKDMIRLGNAVKVEKDGSLVGRGDVNGLRELTGKTKNMIDKKLQRTWIACQVMDTDEKLEMSARLIVRKKRTEAFMTCVVGALPIVQQAQLGYMFLAMIRSLSKIWGVPEPMEKALMAEFFMEEGGNNLLKHFLKSVVAGVGLVASVAASVFTAGIASVAIVGVLAASGFTQMRASSTLLMTFSLLILGAILYTKSIQSPNDDWDKTLDQEVYKKYANDFANSNYAQDLKKFIVQYKSAWEGTTRVNCQTSRLKSQLINFLRKLMRKRPSSLFSRMKEDMQEDEERDKQSNCNVQDQHSMNDGYIYDKEGEEAHMEQNEEEEEEEEELEVEEEDYDDDFE